MSKTKINVLALWKNSENHIQRTLYQLDNLLTLPDFEFQFFFYGNDHRDRTNTILEEWKTSHPELLIINQYEELGAPSFGSVTSNVRTAMLAHFRNKCKRLATGYDSIYSLVIDTDLEWDNDDFLALYYTHCDREIYPIVGALGSTVQNLEDYTFGNAAESVYDIFCMRDREGSACMYFADSPFPIKSDNDDFRNGKPVKVMAAFGGMGLYRSEIYNQCTYYGQAASEHVSLSYQMSKFGDLYVVPSCRPRTDIDLSKLNLPACENIGRENLKRFRIENKLREWSAADKYEFEFKKV
jgi:hypothetical protein